MPMITGRKIAKECSGNGATPPRNTPLIAEPQISASHSVNGIITPSHALRRRLEEGRGAILEACPHTAWAVEPHRQEPAVGVSGYVGERVRDAVHQPEPNRLGDAVHAEEGAADGGAGADRAAAGEGEARGLSRRRFE